MIHVAVFADFHFGSSVAPWPRHHIVVDGGEHRASKPQLWLNKCLKDATKDVQKLRPKPIVVLNGDLVQGAHERDAQLCTTKISIQQDVAISMLEPLVKASKETYAIRGTPWHAGKSGESEDAIAKDLGMKENPETKEATWAQLFLDVGCVIHFAHGIGVSSNPAYEATGPLKTLVILRQELQTITRNAPDIKAIVRSHRHRYIHIDTVSGEHAIVTPGWQLQTEFVISKGLPTLPHIGWVLLSWDGKDLTVKPRFYPLPGPHVERA